MSPPTRDSARRRHAQEEALAVLREARSTRAPGAAERIRVARAYRVLGDTANAGTWYRSAIDALSARGEALKALALAKEMAELMPREQRAFAELADRFAKDGRESTQRLSTRRIAVPIARVAQPLPEDGPVLDATELLKVYEAENVGASSAPPHAQPLPSLVPPDVLEMLHARGEIDLYDVGGRPIARLLGEEEEVEITDETEIEVLEDEAAGTPVDAEQVIAALQRVPLFSDLGREAFLELSQAVRLRTVGERCYVFREGEQASSFFLLAEGSVEVVRRLRRREIVLRHFEQGEAFGLFGLFAGEKRAASVRALGNVSVLEVPAGALAYVMSEHPSAKAALSAFYKNRLLETFFASSPIFEDLDEVARRRLIGQFGDRRLATGDSVVSPGEVFNGLFLVIGGGLQVKKRLGGGAEQSLARLGRGQFFGVVSALSGNPCRCSISATEPSMLTCLTQKSFNDFVKDYPSLRQLPQRLEQEKLLVEKDLFVGDLGIPGLS